MRYQEAFEIYRTYTGLAQSELNYRHIQLTEAHNKIQEAIEKANKYDNLVTPKKVKVWSFVNARGKHIDVYYCGSCDQYIDRIKYENHCFNCGQALDWSDK